MSGLLHSEIMYYIIITYYMQQFSLVYNNIFVFLELVDEPRPTYGCGQFMQGSSSGGGPIHARVPIQAHTQFS